MMNFTACILHRILLGRLNQGGWVGLDIWHAQGNGRSVHMILAVMPESKSTVKT